MNKITQNKPYLRRLLFATEKLDERSGSLFIFCQSLILVRIQVETLVLATSEKYTKLSAATAPRRATPRAHVLAKDDNNTAFILTSCHDASLLFLPFFSACLALPCPALPAHFFLSSGRKGTWILRYQQL